MNWGINPSSWFGDPGWIRQNRRSFCFLFLFGWRQKLLEATCLVMVRVVTSQYSLFTHFIIHAKVGPSVDQSCSSKAHFASTLPTKLRLLSLSLTLSLFLQKQPTSLIFVQQLILGYNSILVSNTYLKFCFSPFLFVPFWSLTFSRSFIIGLWILL